MRTDTIADSMKEVPRILRACFFHGTQFECPICEWHLRSFTDRRNRGGLLAHTPDGYCPRCGTKARHRRMWLYLSENTDILTRKQRLLHVAPRPGLGKRLMNLETVDYVGIGLKPGPAITSLADVSSLPMQDNTFDMVLCMHVLEHVIEDLQAMSEIFRVLRPNGVALISFPLRLDQPTAEDVTVRDPAERKRRFGERGHYRWYGTDASDRLRSVGFDVSLDLGSNLSDEHRARYGLRTDENIFHCRKPASP